MISTPINTAREQLGLVNADHCKFYDLYVFSILDTALLNTDAGPVPGRPQQLRRATATRKGWTGQGRQARICSGSGQANVAVSIHITEQLCLQAATCKYE
jgi:hypothetical protein